MRELIFFGFPSCNVRSGLRILRPSRAEVCGITPLWKLLAVIAGAAVKPVCVDFTCEAKLRQPASDGRRGTSCPFALRAAAPKNATNGAYAFECETILLGTEPEALTR